MNHLNSLSSKPYKPSRISSKTWVILCLAVALLGFADSLYLTIEHYNGGGVKCVIVTGCNDVLTSSYATVFGIPVAILGVVYYLFVFVFLLYVLDSGRWTMIKNFWIIGTFGLAASVALIFIQAVILKAFCIYCLASAATSTLLFIFSILMRKRS